MKKRLFSAFLALCIIICCLAGCGAENFPEEIAAAEQTCALTSETTQPAETEPSAESDLPPETYVYEEEPAGDDASLAETDPAGGKPWIDSSISGNISADTPADPRQDLYLYSNKEWLLNAKIPDGYGRYSHFDELGGITVRNAINMLKSGDAPTHDAELIQTLFRLYTDIDARNEAGCEVLRETYELILSFESLDEIADFMADPYSDAVLPFNITVSAGLTDSQTYYPYFEPVSLILGDPAEYTVETEYGSLVRACKRDIFVYIAGRLGMSGDDADSCFRGALELEKMLAENIYTYEEQMRPDFYSRVNNPMSFEEMTEKAGAFPLRKIFEDCGVVFDSPYIAAAPNYFKSLDAVYREENIGKLKDYFLVRFILDRSTLLDEETERAVSEAEAAYMGTTGAKPLEDRGYAYVRMALPDCLGREYVRLYGKEEDKKRVEEICCNIIDGYREILLKNTWASEETIEYAVRKLDSMRVNVGWPDKWDDFSGLDISGLSLIGACLKINEYSFRNSIKLIGTSPDAEMWSQGLCVLDCNAFYNHSDNSINIIMGILGGNFYSPGMTAEELYSSIGFVIGHEISHAFDSKGAQMDIDGNLNNWWTERDYDEFWKRVGKLDRYLDSIRVTNVHYVTGSSIDSEMMADITSMQCMLLLAGKEESFDYRVFFDRISTVFAAKVLYSKELSFLQGDSHPLAYLRGNVPAQQFDEFYETYGVTEGDNMYLAPEDRVLVW